MLRSRYFVLQPCDVITKLMTSSFTVLPSSLHSVTSFGSTLGPVIVPYISADAYSSTLDESADHTRSDYYCLRQSADQVTWPSTEATPPRDDVIGYLDDENGESLSTHGLAQCCDVTSGSGCTNKKQDGDGQRELYYPLYCTVCSVRLNGGEQAKEHFQGRTHARRLRMTSSPSRFSDVTQQVSRSCCNINL